MSTAYVRCIIPGVPLVDSVDGLERLEGEVAWDLISVADGVFGLIRVGGRDVLVVAVSDGEEGQQYAARTKGQCQQPLCLRPDSIRTRMRTFRNMTGKDWLKFWFEFESHTGQKG